MPYNIAEGAIMEQRKADQSTVRLEARIPAHIKENLVTAAALTGPASPLATPPWISI
jgi:hypothetical protein